MPRAQSRLALPTLTVMTAMLALHFAAAAQVILTPVAVQGHPAPGTANSYTQFLAGFGIGAPVIDNAGNVAFRAFLDSSFTSDTAIFRGPPGAVALWSREGVPLPGGGVSFGHNSDNQSGFPVVNAGVVAVQHPVAGGSALVAGQPGALTLLARTGLAAPGLPAGVTFASVDADPAVGPAGQVGGLVSLAGGSHNGRTAIVSYQAGALSYPAMTGVAPPGVGGTTLLSLRTPAYNAAGRTAFWGSYNGGSTQAIFSDRAGTLAPVYRTGDPAPGFPSAAIDSIHSDGSSPQFNSSGQLAFRATVASIGGVIYSESFGLTHVVAREFSQTPNSASDTFGSFTGTPLPLFNDRGDTAFWNRANFSGINADAVFVDYAAGLRLIARQGAASPIVGLSLGAIEAASLRLNNRGNVAFAAILTGSGVTAANDRALLATGVPGGPLIKIVREGDVVDVAGDGSDLRTVAAIECSYDDASVAFHPRAGLNAGHGSFNDANTLAFTLTFAGGTQAVFVAAISCQAIVTQPSHTSVCPGGTAALMLVASGPGAPVYRWQVEDDAHTWVDLADGPSAGGTISGAASANLAIASPPANSALHYRCRVTGACGTLTSDPATVTVSCPNPADVTGLGGGSGCDGLTTVDDIVFFLAAFFSANLAVADIASLGGAQTPDGQLSADDLIAFLGAFFAGCA